MNNERQHSEYKIIETVATPTFDGVSVETHPEDQLGGGDTPTKTLVNGGHYLIGFGWPSGQYLGIEAGEDEDMWLLMFEQTDDDKSLYFYNSSGVRQGAKLFMSNEERTEFLEGVISDMTEYIGSECYTEPIPETLDLTDAVIIP